jgi:FKBP-type peptidyl-prolyl cis-trans isomerase FklB
MTPTRIAVLVVGWLAAETAAAQTLPGETTGLATEQDRVSYSIGVSLGRSVEQQKVEVEADLLLRGVRDGLSGAELLLTEEEIANTVAAVQAELRRKQLDSRRLGGEENKKKGEAFLAENRVKDGVVTLPSGLQYRVLEPGSGKTPTEGDRVEVRYRGRLVDGTEFGSSPASGTPGTFKVNGVIAGWNEALKRMSVGARWQLFVPHQLAYGGRGAGRLIGPFAALIFDLELVAIR